MATGREKLAGIASGGGAGATPIPEFPPPPKELLEFGPQEFRDGFMKWYRQIENWRKGMVFNPGGGPSGSSSAAP